MDGTIIGTLAGAVVSAAVTFAVMYVWARRRRNDPAEEERLRQRLAENDAVWRERLQEKEADCQRRIDEKGKDCASRLAGKDADNQRFLQTVREEFAVLAQRQLASSVEGLSDLNQKRVGETLRPLREELDRFREAFDANRTEQIRNKASFDQAIADLGKRALQIGTDAENLARALKSESKTQGDWGEMVLSNILSAAGLKEGVDFLPQEQETDAEGNRLIPDVEIPLPNKEKLLIDSKASVTAYLDYVAATDETARAQAVKAHVASVRKHMDELANKDYARNVKGSQGYVLMFIPNEGSYLLAMENDRKLATDAFRRHVIIVNPTTLLLCLQIVALLRSREAQSENAEKIADAAAKMYEKFAGFTETFADIRKKLGALSAAYDKAHGQLCEGKGNLIRQMENMKDMGVVTAKSVNAGLLNAAESAETAEVAAAEPPKEIA